MKISWIRSVVDEHREAAVSEKLSFLLGVLLSVMSSTDSNVWMSMVIGVVLALLGKAEKQVGFVSKLMGEEVDDERMRLINQAVKQEPEYYLGGCVVGMLLVFVVAFIS